VRIERLQTETTYPRHFRAPDGFLDLQKTNSQPFRLGVLGPSPLHPAMIQFSGLETIDGRSPVFFRRYKDVFEQVVIKRLNNSYERDFFRAYPYDLYLGNDVLKLNLHLLRLLNVRYLVSSQQLPETNDLHLVRSASKSENSDSVDHDLYLYELRGYFERMFLVSNIETMKSDTDVLAALGSSDSQDLRETAFVAEKDTVEKGNRLRNELDQPSNSRNQVEILAYTADKILIRTTNDKPGFLIVSNNFHEDWNASVNGVEETIFRANHAFQGVQISNAGTNLISLEFVASEIWYLHLLIPVGVVLILFALFSPRFAVRIRR